MIKPVEINLVAYEPQDAERIGVWRLAGHKRHEFLRQALPRFTEMELALGEQAEKELAAKLNAKKGFVNHMSYALQERNHVEDTARLCPRRD